ncbi:MAG: putative membrane protein [Thermoproteota archaeon]|jgi:uncharacterized membrane protein
MNTKTLFGTTLALGIAAASMGAQAAPEWAKPGDTIVKCAGIAKKMKNDCGANGHQCGGMAKTASDPKEWVYVPEGVCEKIVGAKVLAKKTIAKK